MRDSVAVKPINNRSRVYKPQIPNVIIPSQPQEIVISAVYTAEIRRTDSDRSSLVDLGRKYLKTYDNMSKCCGSYPKVKIYNPDVRDCCADGRVRALGMC